MVSVKLFYVKFVWGGAGINLFALIVLLFLGGTLTQKQ